MSAQAPPPPNLQPAAGNEARAKSWPVIVVAIIGAVATIAAAVIGVSVGGQGDAQAPVKVTITNEDKISPEFTNEVTIEGEVENLGPGQTVWAFDAERSDMKISAHNGPCPVNPDGKFTCPPIFVGDTEKDINQPFRLFVAVLDDSQIRQQIDMNIEREKGRYRAMPGVTDHPPGVAEDSVDSIMKG